MATVEKLIFNENSVQLILDTSEILNISYDAYMKYSPASGDELDSDRYFVLFNESEKFRCISLSFRYLSIRSRSVFEIKTYLKKKKFSQEIIDEVIDYLNSRNYIDDEAFAELYVTSKQKSGKFGRDLIIKGLYEKGVKKPVIESVIARMGADRAEINSLIELAKKKYEQVKEKKDPLIKVSQYLRSRGFVYEDIKRALKSIDGAGEDGLIQE